MDKNQTELFRAGGHMRDSMLKKTSENEQPIYDLLNAETRRVIEKKSITVDFVNQHGGKIELTGSEWKLVDVLCELLHEKSINNNEPTKPDFYTSKDGIMETVYGCISAPSEILFLKLYDITKRYKGRYRVSGKDIKTVEKMLQEWSDNVEKRILIRYTRETIKPDKSKKVQIIETFQSLIGLFYEQSIEYDSNEHIVKKENDIRVYLNPIFRDQIETKYINFPIGLTQRMIDAWGGHNISEIAFKLRDYLAREHSSKRFRCEINLEKLYWQLSEKWVKEGRKKVIQTYLDRAIETVKKIGLLKEHILETNKNGEPKMVFILHEKWV